MCPERSKPDGDGPEPEEVLTEPPAQSPEHVPSDDREVLLDDPALPEVPVEDDDPRAG